MTRTTGARQPVWLTFLTGELSNQVGTYIKNLLAWESGREGEGPEDNLRGGTGISVD